MKKSAIEKNIEYSERFMQPMMNQPVPREIRDIIEKGNVKSIIDMGCGDGIFVNSISKEFPDIEIVGVDISPRRINDLKKKFPNYEFHVADVCDTGLKKTFDLVHSSQVIEHVPDDKKMVKEMAKLIKKDGILFCSSVMKKPGSIYRYRNNGKFVLDPTHEREYKNKKAYLDVFRENFRLVNCWVSPTKRKVLGAKIRIPGFSQIYGIWKLR